MKEQGGRLHSCSNKECKAFFRVGVCPKCGTVYEPKGKKRKVRK